MCVCAQVLYQFHNIQLGLQLYQIKEKTNSENYYQLYLINIVACIISNFNAEKKYDPNGLMHH